MSKYFEVESDIPAEFEIGVLKGGTALKVSAHTAFADYLNQLTLDCNRPLFRSLESSLEIPSFKGFLDENQPWGFGDVMLPIETKNPDWVAWECLYPNGKESSDVWQGRFAISATLNVFSLINQLFDGKTSSLNPQLLYLSMSSNRGDNGGAFEVDLTKACVSWLATQPETENQKDISTPMVTAYDHLTGSDTGFKYGRFQAMLRRPFWINFNVPGSACGLDPRDYHFHTNPDGSPQIKGYQLLPHNIDSPVQQLSLLMGLAAMHDQIRADFIEQSQS